jgi:hypothetical protein
MGRGRKLLAVEPKSYFMCIRILLYDNDNLEKRTFGVVSDCKVPLGDLSLGAENLDPARIKTASLRLARVRKG